MNTCDKVKIEFPPLSETDCPVDWALKIAEKAAAESCGRGVMCREGTVQIALIIKDVTTGKAGSDDPDLILDLCSVMAETGSCEQVREAASLIARSVNDYREEWNSHILRKRCAALQCAAYTTVAIYPDKCTGCGDCSSVCPENAIAGLEGLIHLIDAERCTRCLKCLEICSVDAVAKFGAVLPKLPAEPVPVGSFVADTGRRRRRRG